MLRVSHVLGQGRKEKSGAAKANLMPGGRYRPSAARPWPMLSGARTTSEDTNTGRSRVTEKPGDEYEVTGGSGTESGAGIGGGAEAGAGGRAGKGALREILRLVVSSAGSPMTGS